MIIIYSARQVYQERVSDLLVDRDTVSPPLNTIILLYILL